jgi:hypothetical protein
VHEGGEQFEQGLERLSGSSDDEHYEEDEEKCDVCNGSEVIQVTGTIGCRNARDVKYVFKPIGFKDGVYQPTGPPYLGFTQVFLRQNPSRSHQQKGGISDSELRQNAHGGKRAVDK